MKIILKGVLFHISRSTWIIATQKREQENIQIFIGERQIAQTTRMGTIYVGSIIMVTAGADGNVERYT